MVRQEAWASEVFISPFFGDSKSDPSFIPDDAPSQGPCRDGANHSRQVRANMLPNPASGIPGLQAVSLLWQHVPSLPHSEKVPQPHSHQIPSEEGNSFSVDRLSHLIPVEITTHTSQFYQGWTWDSEARLCSGCRAWELRGHLGTTGLHGGRVPQANRRGAETDWQCLSPLVAVVLKPSCIGRPRGGGGLRCPTRPWIPRVNKSSFIHKFVQSGL